MTLDALLKLHIDKPSEEMYKKAKSRFDSLAKPLDGFGRFEDMICTLAAVQGTDKPDISKKALVIMCADNGVVKEGVSQADPKVTAEVAALMAHNRSTVGVMTEGAQIDIIPVDIGMDSPVKIEGLTDRRIMRGTGDIALEPAMSREQCLEAIEAGIKIAGDCHDRGMGLVATGEMGIGNTTTSTALFCALSGEDPAVIVGRGAGLSDEGLKKKTDVITGALAFHKLNNTSVQSLSPAYVIDALSKVGGLDIAGLAGLYTGCAINHITVVIDGFISAVAALTAYYILPGTRDYMLASHMGREKGCGKVLERLGLVPVIDADMALGEGSGAIMLFPLLDMVMSVYDNGTMFDDTPIEQYRRFDT